MYHLPKPRPDGQTALYLTPLELLDHLAALVPPPRKHRRRYHGVLALNSPLRPAVTAHAGLPKDLLTHQAAPQAPTTQPDPAPRRRASQGAYLWAVLLARIYEVLPLIRPQCGRPMRLIACVTDVAPVQRILAHIGADHHPAAHLTGTLSTPLGHRRLGSKPGR